MKTTTNIIYSAFALFAFVCFALAPQARATCQEGCGTDNRNTFLGNNALINTSGHKNTAVGADAMGHNDTGSSDTAVGASALQFNHVGVGNTAVGFRALWLNDNSNNTAIGANALGNNTGSRNTALGANAGVDLADGVYNIDIGADVVGVAEESNTIRIGNQGTQTATFIAGISGTPISDGVPIGVDASGQLGVRPSSARYKEAIQPMDKASEAILALKPVTFRYKHDLDPEGIPQFGLVAEAVERVNPDLVARDDHGKPFTVRYEAVNAMLLNEFLKEHRKVEQLEKQVAAITAGLQKVSAQLELSKTAPQMVLNNQESSHN